MRLRLLFPALLLTAALPAAADWVNHRDGTPQQPDDKRIQVFNFWAAWCAPCRKEIPAMSAWYEQKGKKQRVQMAGIAIDSEANVAAFLRQTPVAYPIWRYTGQNSRAMMRAYGNTVGALPYTLVHNPRCGAKQTVLGEADGKKLDAAVAAVKRACAAGKAGAKQK